MKNSNEGNGSNTYPGNKKNAPPVVHNNNNGAPEKNAGKEHSNKHSIADFKKARQVKDGEMNKRETKE